MVILHGNGNITSKGNITGNSNVVDNITGNRVH